MRKYASFEVLSAVQTPGRGRRAHAATFVKSAHRADFKYDPKPGFLSDYPGWVICSVEDVRSRAIRLCLFHSRLRVARQILHPRLPRCSYVFSGVNS